MVTARAQFSGGLIVALLLTLTGLAGVLGAADDEEAALRRKALALNDVTGDKPIQGEIKNLVNDVPAAKKLLKAAVPLAKQKDQPFNYNGAYILANTALRLRDPETSKVFFRICTEEASKLQSGEKLYQAYRGMLEIIELLYEDKKYQESLKVSQEFLETLDRQGISSEVKANVLRQMCRALAKQGKVDEARRLVDNLLKVRENDWRNLELKAWLQSETGHPDEAVKTYEKVVERLSDDEALEKDEKAELKTVVRESIIELLVKLGKTDEASRVIDDILKDRKDDLGKLLLKAQLQTKINRYPAALKTYEEMLERIPKDETLKKEEQKALLQDEVRERMILLLVKLGKVDEATRVMEEILKGRKDDLSKLELKAALEQRIGHYPAAAKTYQELLERLAKDESLDQEKKTKAQRKIRYALSNVYVELGKINQATQQLQKLLAEEPDSPSYNNDLGYIWADHDQNLAEAEKLIRKAIEEDRKQRRSRADSAGEDDKDNAAYLDSLGWVLYKQKKYEEAKKYLLEAIDSEEGKNIEIYDHLGDVYMALGEKTQAVDIWKKALQLETNSRREDQRRAEIEKKLKAQP